MTRIDLYDDETPLIARKIAHWIFLEPVDDDEDEDDALRLRVERMLLKMLDQRWVTVNIRNDLVTAAAHELGIEVVNSDFENPEEDGEE